MTRYVALVGLFAASPAWALDTYMWGVGPKIGTTVLPGAFPSAFPSAVEEDENGDPLLSKARFDGLFGVTTTYYANAQNRLGLDLDVDLAKHFDREQLVIRYDYVVPGEAIDFIMGGGIGAGTMRFVGEEPEDAALTRPRLRVNTFPARAEIGALVRDGMRGYQVLAFGQFDIPSRSNYLATDGTDSNIGLGLYLSLGIEISVQFGDFDPPRRRK